MEHIINKLKKELANKTLPGWEAQVKMAPLKSIIKSPGKDAKKAGILILLYPKKEELYTVFIKRNTYPGVHSGQISFPGGQKEKNDNNLIQTAIRETEEEVGADLTNVEIIGTLTPLFIFVSNFDVLPVVGWLEETPTFNPDKKEVETIIEVNVKEFLNDKNLTCLYFNRLGEKTKAPCYSIGNYQIWGATAMIISEAVEIMRDLIK